MDLLTLKYENGISILEALNVSATGFVVVLLILALLAVLVLLLSKGVRSVEKGAKKKKSAPKAKAEKTPAAVPAKAPAASVPAPAATIALPANCSTGQLDLYDVDEKTAAVIMAIISHESGIPLNRLQFKSIKAIEK